MAPGSVACRLYHRSKNRISFRTDPDRKERFSCLFPKIHSRFDFLTAPQLSQTISTMNSRSYTSLARLAGIYSGDCSPLRCLRPFALHLFPTHLFVRRVCSNVILFAFRRTEVDRTTLEDLSVVPTIKERNRPTNRLRRINAQVVPKNPVLLARALDDPTRIASNPNHVSCSF